MVKKTTSEVGKELERPSGDVPSPVHRLKGQDHAERAIGKSESLKTYLSRFNKQLMEVDKISDDVALMVVLAGLRPRTRFWWSVHEHEPRTYHEFLNRAKKIHK